MDSITSHIVGKWFQNKYNEVDLQLAPVSKICKKGCDWCCYQSIEILNWEEPLILEYINTKLSPSQKRIVKQRLEEWFNYFDRIVTGKTEVTIHELFIQLNQQQGTDRFPCVFLHHHLCLIYPVRPMCCRMHVTGENVELCKADPLCEASSEAINLRKKVLNEIIHKIPTSLNLLNFAVARLLGLGYRNRKIEDHLLQSF